MSLPAATALPFKTRRGESCASGRSLIRADVVDDIHGAAGRSLAVHREIEVLHFSAFFCLAFFVRAAAAAFEAFVASFLRSAAVIELVRANPPRRAISRTSMSGEYT